ncbi:MAG TPA: hypothetical protein VF487_12430 [Chitinophagaceae bacterium]
MKQALLRLDRLSNRRFPAPYCLRQLSQEFATGGNCMHALLKKMYASAGSWDMPDNDTIILTKVITSAGLHAFGATVTVLLHRNGNVDFNCRIRNGSHIAGYDYKIGVLVSTISGKVLFLKRSGHINAARIGDSERVAHRNETVFNQPVADLFEEFVNSYIETNTEYSDNFTSTVEDCIEFVVGWAVGTLAVTYPYVGLIILVGAELSSLIDSGSLYSGARLINGTLWMKGPHGTFLAIVGEGIAALATNSRDLSENEYQWACERVFSESLPPRENIIVTDGHRGNNRAYVFPRFDGKITLNMSPDGFADARLHGDQYGVSFLHEMTHVWQIHHSSSNFILFTKGLNNYICETLWGKDSVYGIDIDKLNLPFSDYNLEQQANIVSKWYARWFGSIGSGNQALYEFLRPLAEKHPAYRYIQMNIQAGIY